MSRLRFAYAVSGLTVSAIVCATALHLIAFTNCTGPSPDIRGVSFKWGLNATISVTASYFPSNLQTCVQQAFNNWNNATISNGSGVTFGAVVFGSPVNTTGTTNVYQVTYGTVSGGEPGDTTGNADSGLTHLKNANTTVDTSQNTCTDVTVTMAHEIGHTMGLGDCHACSTPDQSVEFPSIPPITVPPYQTGPTPCDNQSVQSIVKGCLAATFTCSAGLPCCAGTVCHSGKCTVCQTDCPYPLNGCIPCQNNSPIVLDLSGNGFSLTSAANGVRFDISGTGNPVQMGWTAPGADNAFLALPGPDGLVHNGKELFGNFTPQPQSALVSPNGFTALAVYDQSKNGGNDDGVIDAKDAVFVSLRLWIDANHDGISQPEELHTLPSQGVISISLSYKEDKRTDQYGNQFRFRAAINPNDRDASTAGRTAYDVFFVGSDQPTTNNSCILPEIKVTTGVAVPSGTR